MNKSEAEVSAHNVEVDAFLEKLGAFLRAPNHADADWPLIPDDELQAGADLMYELVDLKWGRDCDDDSPIRLRLHEKRHYEDIWDGPLRRAPRAEEAPAAAQERMLSNIRIISGAMSACSHALDRTYNQLEEVRTTTARRSAAVPVYQVRYEWEGEGDGVRFPCSLHLSEEDAALASFPGYKRLGGRHMLAVPGRSTSASVEYGEFRKELAEAFGQVCDRVDIARKVGFALEAC